MLKRCPIFNSTNACDLHGDCLFLRNAGCSLVLSATIAEENQSKLKNIEVQMGNLESKINWIISNMK